MGADDRAGIFIILSLVDKGYKPHIIFTDLEEVGCIGAMDLAKKYPYCPFEKCNALIQLDRCNKMDAVFYDCDNKDFIDMIESYGFESALGSFSDISVIAPAWEIAAVNLSIGYYDEHSYVERLNVSETYLTMNKVELMLKESHEWIKFKYVPLQHSEKYLYFKNGSYIDFK